jgi:Fe2+ or Zn2+ uptake regulation protein
LTRNICKSFANNATLANMSQINPELATTLKNNGFSLTKQRLLVFDLLENSEPLSMHDLYERAKGKLDRASLYRIINTFESLGIVQRINIGWKYKIELSDRFTEHHHHLSCVKCDKIIPINEDEFEHFIKRLTKLHNFKAIGHQVEVQGYCESCLTTSVKN